MTDKDTIRNLEEKIRRLQQESKQAIEIVKRLEEYLSQVQEAHKKSNYGRYDDMRIGREQIIAKLQSILKGDKI